MGLLSQHDITQMFCARGKPFHSFLPDMSEDDCIWFQFVCWRLSHWLVPNLSSHNKHKKRGHYLVSALVIVHQVVPTRLDAVDRLARKWVEIGGPKLILNQIPNSKREAALAELMCRCFMSPLWERGKTTRPSTLLKAIHCPTQLFTISHAKPYILEASNFPKLCSWGWWDDSHELGSIWKCLHVLAGCGHFPNDRVLMTLPKLNLQSVLPLVDELTYVLNCKPIGEGGDL